MSQPDVAALRERIASLVGEHYSHGDNPMWLSTLGGKLTPEQRAIIPHSQTLSGFIESSLAGEVSVIRSPSDRTLVAVSTAGKELLVREQLDRRVLAKMGPAAPHSLRVAFARAIPSGYRVFYRVERPFKYVVAERMPEGPFVEIEEEFRLSTDTMVPKGAALPLEVEEQLSGLIAKWANSHNLELGIFKKAPVRSQPAANVGAVVRRLLEAQKPGVRASILIPADIVLLILETD